MMRERGIVDGVCAAGREGSGCGGPAQAARTGMHGLEPMQG